MKKLRQVGVAGMIVASLATVPGAAVASSNSGPNRAPQSATMNRRTAEAAYQQRLSFLATVLEADRTELEFKLSRLAAGQPI